MRRRRKNDQDAEAAAILELVEEAEAQPRPAGPVDVADLDPDATYIDLGSLLVRPPDDLDLRLQVEEETGTVMSVLLVGEDGLVEVRAFAASRSGGIWDSARGEIAADCAQRGGSSAEREGPFGTELYCEVPVTGPNGEELVQPSRVVGIDGPRWFVRATIAGRPAQDPENAARFEEVVRTLAVRRGNEAMAPGEALPLRLPPEARPHPDADAD